MRQLKSLRKISIRMAAITRALLSMSLVRWTGTHNLYHKSWTPVEDEVRKLHQIGTSYRQTKSIVIDD